ncbi:hypothetical protein K7432_000075 [Basidiobolus ranarum]|uniref:Uncharacterized protein n=1 Tax=Basidiobolus ranarum TaxID=34480 RepID=A0ABR2WBS3_9FUNG
MTSTRPSRNSEARGYRNATNEHDRLKRALVEPVQSWVKKWTFPNNSKHLQIYKWVKADREHDFEDDSSDDEPYPIAASETETSTLAKKRGKSDEEIIDDSIKRQRSDAGGDTDVDTPKLDNFNTPQDDTPGSVTVTHASSVNTPDVNSTIDTPIDKASDMNSQSSAKTSSPVNTTSIENTNSQMNSPMEETVDSSVETPLESTYAPSVDSPPDSVPVSSGNMIEKSGLNESFVTTPSENAELENDSAEQLEVDSQKDKSEIETEIEQKPTPSNSNDSSEQLLESNSQKDTSEVEDNKTLTNSNDSAESLLEGGSQKDISEAEQTNTENQIEVLPSQESSSADVNMEDAFVEEKDSQEVSVTEPVSPTGVETAQEEITTTLNDTISPMEESEPDHSISNEVVDEVLASTELDESSGQSNNIKTPPAEIAESRELSEDMTVDTNNETTEAEKENRSDIQSQAVVNPTNPSDVAQQNPEAPDSSAGIELQSELQDNIESAAQVEDINAPNESQSFDEVPENIEIEKESPTLEVQSNPTEVANTTQTEDLKPDAQSVLSNADDNQSVQITLPEAKEDDIITDSIAVENSKLADDTTELPEEITHQVAENPPQDVNEVDTNDAVPEISLSENVTPQLSTDPVKHTQDEILATEPEAEGLGKPAEEIVPAENETIEEKQESPPKEKQSSALGALCSYSDDLSESD